MHLTEARTARRSEDRAARTVRRGRHHRGRDPRSPRRVDAPQPRRLARRRARASLLRARDPASARPAAPVRATGGAHGRSARIARRTRGGHRDDCRERPRLGTVCAARRAGWTNSLVRSTVALAASAARAKAARRGGGGAPSRREEEAEGQKRRRVAPSGALRRARAGGDAAVRRRAARVRAQPALRAAARASRCRGRPRDRRRARPLRTPSDPSPSSASTCSMRRGRRGATSPLEGDDEALTRAACARCATTTRFFSVTLIARGSEDSGMTPPTGGARRTVACTRADFDDVLVVQTEKESFVTCRTARRSAPSLTPRLCSSPATASPAAISVDFGARKPRRRRVERPAPPPSHAPSRRLPNLLAPSRLPSPQAASSSRRTRRVDYARATEELSPSLTAAPSRCRPA